MDFNADKCKVFTITNKKSLIATIYSILGEELEVVVHHPYLGIELDLNLSWNSHVNKITKKATNVLNLVRRNLYSCPEKTKAKAYTTIVLDGPHHYAIGDHGNLIVAVPRDFQSNITGKYLQYSLDQGRCWNTFKFTDDPMMIRGLVTEPNSKKRTFSIWGVIEGDKEKTWQVVTVNFEDILTRRC
eukprot:gene1947-17485_t